LYIICGRCLRRIYQFWTGVSIGCFKSEIWTSIGPTYTSTRCRCSEPIMTWHLRPESTVIWTAQSDCKYWHWCYWRSVVDARLHKPVIICRGYKTRACIRSATLYHIRWLKVVGRITCIVRAHIERMCP